jgi:hypothetical protein
VLQTSDASFIGVYYITLTYENNSVTTSLSFTATILLLEVSSTFPVFYDQVYGEPSLVIKPACVVSPPGSYTITYTIDNLATLPPYLNVTGTDVTLP